MLLFSRTGPLTDPRFHLFAHHWMSWAFSIFGRDHTAFELGKQLKKHVFFPFFSSPKVLSKYWILFNIFPNFKQNLVQTFCSLKSAIFRYYKVANGTTHTCTWQDITQQSHLLQPYYNREMTYQNILYLHLVIVFHAANNFVIWFVWKPLNCTTYSYQEFEMFLAW